MQLLFLLRPRNVLLGLILPMTGVKMACQTHFLYVLLRISFFQSCMLNNQGPWSYGAGWRVEPHQQLHQDFLNIKFTI